MNRIPVGTLCLLIYSRYNPTHVGLECEVRGHGIFDEEEKRFPGYRAKHENPHRIFHRNIQSNNDDGYWITPRSFLLPITPDAAIREEENRLTKWRADKIMALQNRE